MALGKGMGLAVVVRKGRQNDHKANGGHNLTFVVLVVKNEDEGKEIF